MSLEAKSPHNPERKFLDKEIPVKSNELETRIRELAATNLIANGVVEEDTDDRKLIAFKVNGVRCDWSLTPEKTSIRKYATKIVDGSLTGYFEEAFIARGDGSFAHFRANMDSPIQVTCNSHEAFDAITGMINEFSEPNQDANV